ncbi:hypothetical protein FB451DRAFT_1176728 [Mycena latifolia]|nr:hypothetical protein FB451DRAFT_1176728 [Mycena latifolia]
MSKPSSDIPYGAPQTTARRIQPRVRGSGTAASDSCAMRTTPASDGARAERGRGDTRRAGGAGQGRIYCPEAGARRAHGHILGDKRTTRWSLLSTLSDAKLRGDETHLPGPAPEVPIDWGCHVTDARRGTLSGSAGREGTDGALAEWTAGENDNTTKKTRLNSSICNSCSRGSFIRARRRASGGEEETGAACKAKRTASGSARTASRAGHARGTLGGGNDAGERMHGRSSFAADASAGNDEDSGGDGCDDDEGSDLKFWAVRPLYGLKFRSSLQLFPKTLTLHQKFWRRSTFDARLSIAELGSDQLAFRDGWEDLRVGCHRLRSATPKPVILSIPSKVDTGEKTSCSVKVFGKSFCEKHEELAGRVTQRESAACTKDSSG